MRKPGDGVLSLPSFLLFVAIVVCMPGLLCALQVEHEAGIINGALIIHSPESFPKQTISERQQRAFQRLPENIRMNEYGVLRARLERARVAPPELARTASFDGMSLHIAQGIERFFYRSHARAIETLEPILEHAMDHADVLARRPDLAEQVFQAAVVLIRAYQEIQQTERARNVASKIASVFPTKSAFGRVIPPATVSLLAAAYSDLNAQQAFVELVPVMQQQCAIYVNGIIARQLRVAIDNNRPYYIMVDCNRLSTAVWHFDSNVDSIHQVFVHDRCPLEELITSTGGVSSQYDFERMMKMVVEWSGMDFLVMVNDHPNMSQASLVTVARDEAQRDYHVFYASNDIHDVDALFAVMAGNNTTLTDYAAIHYKKTDSLHMPWTIAMLTSGAGITALGAAFLITGRESSMQVACSPSSSSRLPVSECEEVDEVYFTSPQAFENAKAAARNQYILGYSSVALGAGLMGWGIWRMVNNGSTSENAERIDVQIGVLENAFSVSGSWRMLF